MKRIIAVMVALMFAAIAFNINVSAMTKQDYEQQYFALLSEYQHGYITLEEFQQCEDELTARYTESNTDENGVINSIAQNVTNTVNKVTDGIVNAVGTVGNTVNDWIDDVLNPYETVESVPNIDTNGHGCLVISLDSYYRVVKKIYCGYAQLDPRWDGLISIHGSGYVEEYEDDELCWTGTFEDAGSEASYMYTFWLGPYTKVYGDLRNANGTSADERSNNGELVYSDINKYDFSNASDRELDELLNELNETLKREQPDLTSMEGLLESIYYRLGAIDSDNDNALLSDINTAIIALSNSNDENAAQIIVALGEIKDEIKNMNGDINDNLEDLENNFDKIADFEIPDELLNVDFDNLSDAVKDKVDDIVELITTLVAKGVPMAAINGGLMFYQDIIFNSSEPQDITFDLSFNGEQYNFTILSTNFFGSEGAQALQIIKNFVAIVLGYAWVLAMRKKAASMMN